MPQPRDSSQLSLYETGVGIVNEYTVEPGVCVLPLAQEPPASSADLRNWSPVVVFQLHAPYRIRRVRYGADKINNPPVVPAPQDAGAFVFIGGSITIGNGLNTTFSNFNWTVNTDYVFVENCVSRTQDGFVLGTPPWIWRMSSENSQIYPAANAQNILGAISQSGLDARVGYTLGSVAAQSLNATINPLTGLPTSTLGWGYNQASFLPGVFFNTELINAGPQQGL